MTKRQVFLGGSCDPTTWRQDTAIPILEEAGVAFYNPQVSDWHEGLIELEARAKEESEALLFVIDGQTRAIASILEATEYICEDRAVLVVIEDVEEGAEIEGKAVVDRELKDLNRARSFLRHLVGRYPNATIFDSVQSAVEEAAARLRAPVQDAST